MAINANSYGSLEEVAQLVPRYGTQTGTFDLTTTPPSTAVENMINRVSALVNAYLSSLGFAVPIIQTDAEDAVKNVVLETVASMVEGVRGTGRYSPKNKVIAERGQWGVISQEVRDYLDSIATGLENLGVTRVSGRKMGSVSTIRTDAYSDDINNLEWSGYE